MAFALVDGRFNVFRALFVQPRLMRVVFVLVCSGTMRCAPTLPFNVRGLIRNALLLSQLPLICPYEKVLLKVRGWYCAVA